MDRKVIKTETTSINNQPQIKLRVTTQVPFSWPMMKNVAGLSTSCCNFFWIFPHAAIPVSMLLYISLLMAIWRALQTFKKFWNEPPKEGVKVSPKCLETAFNPLMLKSLNLYISIIFPTFVEVRNEHFNSLYPCWWLKRVLYDTFENQ